jgi:hypothetical protein
LQSYAVVRVRNKLQGLYYRHDTIAVLIKALQFISMFLNGFYYAISLLNACINVARDSFKMLDATLFKD